MTPSPTSPHETLSTSEEERSGGTNGGEWNLYEWWDGDGREAGPWLVAALLGLGFGWAIDGAAGFGVALGFESALLGLWAAFVARRATRDAHALQALVAEIHGIARDTAATAASLADSVSEQAEAVDRLNAREELEILRAVESAVSLLWARMKARQFDSESPAQVPFAIPPEARMDDGLRLYKALRPAEGLELPACRELLNRLQPFRAPADPENPAPPSLDYSPFVTAAWQEIHPLIESREARLGGA
jgi:hypothetical protein